MKFYEFIEKLQIEYDGKIILVKNGAFYNAIGKDAIIIENIFKLKRTCFAKNICKCGFPVYYHNENIDMFKAKLQEKGIAIVVFDKNENGRYSYKGKKYDILFEIKGREIKERRRNTNCLECKNNKYYKELNMYTLLKEDSDKREERLKEILEKIKEYIKL